MMETHDMRQQPIFVHHELDDAGLDPYAFRVYCRIARRAGSNGPGCIESVPNMAEGCNMSAPRLREALDTLVDRGMVEREDRKGLPTVYTLLPKDQWDQNDTPPKNRGPQEVRGAGTPESSGGGPQKVGVGGPQKIGDKDTKDKDTQPKEGARPRAGGKSDQVDHSVDEQTGEEDAAETVQVVGETYPLNWQDPATGRTLAEMDAAERRQAAKGWPLGCGIADAADHPGVEVHAEFYPGVAGAYQRELIAKTLTDAAKDAERLTGKPRAEAAREVLQRWRQALSFWKGNGHRGRSVKRQLQKFKEIAREERAEVPGRTQMPRDLLSVGRRAVA